MPELPEVETVRLGLESVIKDQIITDVEVIFSKSFEVELEKINQTVAGSKVSNLRRRGKVLIIDLDNAQSLLIHLKMTGQLIFVAGKKRLGGGHPTKSLKGKLPDNSTRVVFTFSNGGKLFFNDQRKFGWIKLVPTESVELDSLLSRMGPEPLADTFTLDSFISSVQSRRAPIKAVLLDQSTVAGLGNIYVDEALHMAKIHPLALACNLSLDKLKKLHRSVVAVLRDALSYGGTSFTSYVNAEGLAGNYLDNARVFRRQGQSCTECGSTILKIKVAGRGTHVCSECQKLK